MIDKLKNMLQGLEMEIVSPILEFDESHIDQDKSRVEEQNDIILCEIVNKDSSKCPFQLVFRRGANRGWMTFSIGNTVQEMVAEVLDIEDFSALEDTLRLKEILIKFLKSTVRLEIYFYKGKVHRVSYYVSMWVFDGREGEFKSSVGCWKPPFAKTEKEVKYYQPWI